MSHTRRIAAAGIALAITGTFIAVPAQADAATSSARTVAHTVANAATSGSTATAADSVRSNYKSFSSTAKTPGRTTVSGTRSLAAQAKAAAIPAASASPVIYVEAAPTPCATEIGAGTLNDPYCLLQSAVNKAVSGDTIEVYQIDDENLAYHETVDIVGKSNVTILGEGIGIGDVGNTNSHAFYLDNSTGITVRNMVLSNLAQAVDVVASHNITFDGDYIINDLSDQPAVDISSGSTNVTFSRSSIGNNGGYGVEVDSGVSNTVLASDIIASEFSAGVYASAASGLDIVGDTIQGGCGGSVSVHGASTGVSIENDVFEPNLTMAALCSADESPLKPDVTVDATAAAGTTSDYNDFTFSADTTQAYSWAGVTYATLAAFQAAVAQGAHDAVDPTVDAQMFVTPAGVDWDSTPWYVDAQPKSNSLSIGTANATAPGHLSTDFYGRSSYTDRGAVEYATPSLTAALTLYQAGARTVEAYADKSVKPDEYATYFFAWGDGSTTTSSIEPIATHTYPAPGTYTATVAVTDVFSDTSSAAATIPTAGSEYVPVAPTRILDTRKGIGTGGTIAPIGSGKTLSLTVGGLESIPASATAIAVNLTATDATAGGHINAYPAGAAVPASSNLDFTAGKNVANMAVIPVGTGGVVDFYNGSAGTVDLIADISGYFVTTQEDGYEQITPARILDTRTSTGGHDAPLTPGNPVKLKVAGVGGVPADAKAVEVNLTVASPTKASLVTAYPDGSTEPTVSNVNFTAGQTIANAAIVPIGADGSIDLATPVGSNRMVVDVDGYFSGNLAEAPSAYEPTTPFRQVDTRQGGGPLDAYYYWWVPFGLDGWGDLYNPPVTGAVTNVTVTSVTATSGNLDAFPDNYINGQLDVPNVSSLNFTKGSTVANLVFATPGTDGKTDFLNESSSGSLQLIVDVFGYFQSA